MGGVRISMHFWAYRFIFLVTFFANVLFFCNMLQVDVNIHILWITFALMINGYINEDKATHEKW